MSGKGTEVEIRDCHITANKRSGVRVSGGWGTTEGDWVRFADAWVAAYDKHKARAAARVREVA